MRHYYRTRAVHEALLPNTRSSWGTMTEHAQSWGIMTEHAQVMRHYDRIRAGNETLWPNTRRSWGIMTEHAQITRYYHRTRAVHKALLQNTGSSCGIMTEHGQFVQHCYWNTKHYTFCVFWRKNLRRLHIPSREQKVVLSQQVTAQTAPASGANPPGKRLTSTRFPQRPVWPDLCVPSLHPFHISN